MLKTLTLALTMASFMATAQYKIDRVVYTDPQRVDFRQRPFNHVLMGHKNNELFLYAKNEPSEKDSTFTFIFKRYNMDTDRMIDSVELPPLPRDFHLADMAQCGNQTAIIGHDELFIATPGKLDYISGNDSIVFDKGTVLNDSMILLSVIYNFHPKNQKAGLHMSLLNIKKGEITKSVIYKFPGVEMGFTTINWICSDAKYIYAFAGISGRIFKYDFQLRPVGEVALRLFPDSVGKSNLAYEAQIDSIAYGEWSRLRTIIDEDTRLGTAHSYKSPIYGKDFMVSVGTEMRTKRWFIEKVIKVNNSEFLLTVSRPEYERAFRDIYSFDTKTGSVKLKWKKWRCAKEKQIDVPEQYFAVDVGNEKTSAPIFYKGYVYAPQIHNLSLFKRGTVGDLDELQHNDIAENGYAWHLVKFKL